MSIPKTLEKLTVPIDEVRPATRNPRRGNVDIIAESLERNGQYRPIVVNKPTGEILAGNHTWRAAKQLGWPKIAVTFVDVDEDQAARIILADNRTADHGSYDDAILASMLGGLQDDLTGTGYTLDDLDELLGSTEPAHTADLLADTEDSYKEQYGVIVTCHSEGEQQQVYDALTADGYTCKVVTV